MCLLKKWTNQNKVTGCETKTKKGVWKRYFCSVEVFPKKKFKIRIRATRRNNSKVVGRDAMSGSMDMGENT